MTQPRMRRPQVYWFLGGSFRTPSSRIHGYRIHAHLRRRGWRSVILYHPLAWLGDAPVTAADIKSSRVFAPGDIAIVQKLCGPVACELLTALADLGVATVYVDCDLPLKVDEASRASAVVCSSDALASEYRTLGLPRVHYIPDAFEASRPPDAQASDRSLQCVWFGSAGKWHTVQRLRALIGTPPLADWKLVTVSDHPEADMKWSVRTALRTIHRSDAVVVPTGSTPAARVKSSNRVIQTMALGVPVLAEPIPAYQEVIIDGWNGFLCDNDQQWIAALTALRDRSHRHRIARNAYAFVCSSHSLDQIGGRWEQILHDLLDEPCRHPLTESRRIGRRKIGSRAYRRMAAREGLPQGLRARLALRGFLAWPFDADPIRSTVRMLIRRAALMLSNGHQMSAKSS